MKTDIAAIFAVAAAIVLVIFGYFKDEGPKHDD